jgi:hypothetical protein
VARDGAPTNGSDDTHLYSTFFAIYAATAYARAFSDEGALQLALATFSSMDASHHDDAAGGFNEDSCRPILHQEVLQAASDGGAAQLPRTLNIFLHGTGGRRGWSWGVCVGPGAGCAGRQSHTYTATARARRRRAGASRPEWTQLT